MSKFEEFSTEDQVFEDHSFDQETMGSGLMLLSPEVVDEPSASEVDTVIEDDPLSLTQSEYSLYQLPPTEDEDDEGPTYDVEDVLENPDLYEIEIQSQVFFWALVDESLTGQQTQRLESMIAEHDEARQTFVRCLQLHVDLIYYFHAKRTLEEAEESKPVLWPAILEPLLILFCPDREEREEEWQTRQHETQPLDDLLPFVDDSSSCPTWEHGCLDIDTGEQRVAPVEAGDISVICSLDDVDRKKKPLLSRIIRMIGIR